MEVRGPSLGDTKYSPRREPSSAFTLSSRAPGTDPSKSNRLLPTLRSARKPLRPHPGTHPASEAVDADSHHTQADGITRHLRKTSSEKGDSIHQGKESNTRPGANEERKAHTHLSEVRDPHYPRMRVCEEQAKDKKEPKMQNHPNKTQVSTDAGK
ncbi:hypothetical protein P7K49_032545 [Saguinus oedipus]|uniref:Uncharacterized protein n=1 Tax=Saguinus oedipus TaxID=9490 RepID=A0ABQ9TYJ3_SAGOE|nr:hypothetical protein P7K49_032545 [Saguinus oedipus]